MADVPHQHTDPAADGAARRTVGDGSADWLIREEPLVIDAQGSSVLTMRTPGRDLDLATGFLLGEGVIERAGQIAAHAFEPGDPTALRADTIRLSLTGVDTTRLRGRLTRTHEIRASCGICGLADADALLEGTPPLLPGVPRVTRAGLRALRERFGAEQPLFARTGACHAAVVFDAGGAVRGAGEDVGRHNALDKAVGQAARAGFDLAHGIAMLSGRAGFDLVLKCLRVRLPVILSVSAASALSFDLCRSAGATLIGFLRADRIKVYCDGGRLS